MVRPLIGVLGEDVSRWLVDLPALAGVELRTGAEIVRGGVSIRQW